MRWIHCAIVAASLRLAAATDSRNETVAATEHYVQWESNPLAVSWHFPPNGWEFLINFLSTYYAYLSTLDCKFFFNYL